MTKAAIIYLTQAAAYAAADFNINVKDIKIRTINDEEKFDIRIGDRLQLGHAGTFRQLVEEKLSECRCCLFCREHFRFYSRQINS